MTGNNVSKRGNLVASSFAKGNAKEDVMSFGKKMIIFLNKKNLPDEKVGFNL